MANTLMTTTLPTIVGAGVVSRTTETMFGRSRRGRRRQGKLEGIRVGNRMYRLYTGERGGRYYIRKGRKIYI